jgi:hypothetical protein
MNARSMHRGHMYGDPRTELGRTEKEAGVARTTPKVLVAVLTALFLAAVVAPAARAQDPVIGASGDMACGSNSTGATCAEGLTADVLESIKAEPTGLAAVLPLGDVQYECGEKSNFDVFYARSWGRSALLPLTHPVVGNHEYRVPDGTNGCLANGAGAQGYFSYFGSAIASPQDSANCVPNCKGYYSYDLGTWHLVALNSNCSQVGGCGATSPQGRWLASDLDAAVARSNCILGYWHAPRFSSGGRQTSSVQPFWEILFDHHADVVLTGHDHTYERFSKLGRSSSAAADPSPDPNGIREWIVGVGGRNFTSFTTIRAESQVRDRSSMGVLKMTLRNNGYDWGFRPATGSFTDSGSDTCNGAPVSGGGDTTAPTVSTRSPDAGATGVAVTSNVVATFSESVQGVDTNTFTLTAAGSTQPVSAVVTGSGTQWTLNPDADLAADTTYTATLTGGPTGITDQATSPNPLTTTSWTFRTAAAAGGGGSTTQTLAATADATIDQANPTVNAGSAPRVTADTSPVNQFLLRFDVTSCASPTAATLALTVGTASTDNSTATGAGRVFGVSPTDPNVNWTEGSVTYNTAPATVGTGITTTSSPAVLGAAVSFNVLPLVNGNGPLTLRVAGTSSDGVRYFSKEGSATLGPRLQLTCGSGGGTSDTTPPTAPGQPTVTGVTSSTVSLSWAASSDPGGGVTEYRIFRGTTQAGTSTETSFTDRNLTPATDFSYTVRAVDAAGNVSDSSSAATATTAAAGGGGATTQTFTANADATIVSGGTSNGTGTRITMDASPINDILIRFTVTNCASPSAATLRLTVGSSTDDRSNSGGSIFSTSTSTWSETGVTFATAPPKGTLMASAGAVAANQVVSFDVTSAVTGNGDVTFRGSSTSSDGVRYFSREAGAATAPQLQVTCS